MSSPSASTEGVTDGLEFRFRWDASEHRRLHRVVLRDPSRHKRLVVFAGAGALAAMISYLAGGGTVAWPLAVLIALAFVTMVILSRLVDEVLLPLIGAWMYARHHKGCLPHDQIRRITDEGIEARCTISQSLIRWPGITRARETPEFFLFYTTPTCVVQIPKRAVGDGPELHAIRQRVRQLLGARAELAVPGPSNPTI